MIESLKQENLQVKTSKVLEENVKRDKQVEHFRMFLFGNTNRLLKLNVCLVDMYLLIAFRPIRH